MSLVLSSLVIMAIHLGSDSAPQIRKATVLAMIHERFLWRGLSGFRTGMAVHAELGKISWSSRSKSFKRLVAAILTVMSYSMIDTIVVV